MPFFQPEDEKTVYLKKPEHIRHRLIVFCKGEITEYVLKGTQTLGRPSRTTAPDLPVNAGMVSRKHGEFSIQGNICSYRDLGSTNGTIFEGAFLTPGDSAALHDGDILRIHGKESPDANGDVLLIYTETGPEKVAWTKVPLSNEMAEISIGRAAELSLQDPSVSRQHASLFHATGGWAILDHASTNGIFVNNRRITRPEYLHPGDIIRIAGYYLIFTGDHLYYQNCTATSFSTSQRDSDAAAAPESPASSAPASASNALFIRIEERNVWQRMKKKTLLKDIHMDISMGSMVLILGGSGAGKTTFLNAVMGYEPAEGQILYKNTDIYQEYEKMKYEIGYVPQQDLLRMSDTVGDTLRNAARMRLPSGKSPSFYEKAVSRTLHMLGLEREQDEQIVKLSGGQRKRLSIAVELIGDPSLFFLDEPDSGLDGTMARALMENLRAIADLGKIVMVISHSPDRAIELWDQVIVLAKGDTDNIGHLAFFGSPQEACRFFETDTLEHIVRRINRPDEGGEGRADEFIQKYQRQNRE